LKTVQETVCKFANNFQELGMRGPWWRLCYYGPCNENHME